MSDVDVGRLWPPGLVSGAVGTFMTFATPTAGSNNLTASGHKIAVVFDVPVSGELHSFEYAAPAAGASVATLRASWQNVDASDNPDGGVDQFCLYSAVPSNVWAAPPNALTHDGSAGGTRRTVTVGQRIAAVIDYSAYTSGTVTVNHWASGWAGHGAQIRLFTAAWAAVNQTPALAVRYTDGYRAVFGAVPTRTAPTTTAFNSGSTPDHRALIWTQADDSTCLGLWAFLSGTGACDLVLYEGTTEVGRLSWPICLTNAGMRVGYFSTPITLTGGLTYRAAVVPTSVTSVTARAFTANAVDAQLGGIPDVVAGMGQSTKTDVGGGWTDSTSAIPMVGPVVPGVAAIPPPAADTATGSRFNRSFN
jgi:hypothetical protein